MSYVSLSAQEQPKTEYVFNPHWYVQAQVGGQYTLGEIGFSDLLSPNAQIGVGYNFNKVLGTRLSVNAWQSKAGLTHKGKEYDWKWNYVSPVVDLTVNMSNLICGYNPERKLSVGILAGIGANIAWDNDEACGVKNSINAIYADAGNARTENLSLLWSSTKTRLTGRVGATADYRINNTWSVGLELQANAVNDNYNSKDAANADWYFNALVGVKCNLGKTHSKRTVKPHACEPRVVEKIVEKIVEKPVPVPEAPKEIIPEPLRRDIFFTISSTTITAAEMQKVEEIADYLKKYPSAKVEITGYADKGTGNATINSRLAAKRAQIVVDTLKTKYGISESRITSSSKGDKEQPFAEPIRNRVSICIAK